MAKKFLYLDGTTGFWIESPGAYEQTDFINSSAGAGDAGKPIVLDSSGLISSSMIDDSAIDHGLLAGLGDDDHNQYILVGGTRAFTGDQSMGGFKLTSVGSGAGSITNALDAANKAYVDLVAYGVPRIKGNVAAATTLGGGNIDLTGGTFGGTIDGYTVLDGDRVLIKNQTDATENGIYDYVDATSTFTRSSDFDNSPTGEVYNGVWIPKVENGSTNASTSWIVSSVGTGTNGLHTLGTDSITFSDNTPPSAYNAGNGIDITTNTISVDLATSYGLKFVTGQLGVEPNDFAGDGLVDDGLDNLAIDWAATFTIDAADAKAFKASDIASTTTGYGASLVGIEDASSYYTGPDVESALNELEAQIGGLTSSTFGFTEDNVLADNDALYSALDKLDQKWGDLSSTTNGEGASLVGIEDAGAYFTGSDVEAVLQEIGADLAEAIGIEYTTSAGVTVGDAVYISAADTVETYSTITSNEYVVGLAASTVGAAGTVNVVANDTVLTGVLSGATPGTFYYWNGSNVTTTIPTGTGNKVWRVGVAKNTTDLHVQVELVGVRS